MADNLFSLHLGEESIKMVDGSAVNGKVAINSIGGLSQTPLFYEIDTQKTIEDEGKLLEKLATSLKIKTKNLNVVIPDGMTYSQILEMPRLKEKELLSAIRYQADQFIPMPLDKASLDLEILQEDKLKNKLLVLIVAAPSKLISQVEKLVEAAGFIPDGVENELSATGRFLSSIYKVKPEPGVASVFINFGFSSSSLYLFHHETNLIIDLHTFKIGLNLFLKEIEVNARLDINKAEIALSQIGLADNGSVNLAEMLKPVTSELTTEVEKFIIAEKEKYKLSKISQVFLINQSNRIKFLGQKIQQAVGLPTGVLDLAPYITKTQGVIAAGNDLSGFVGAIGGTLR